MLGSLLARLPAWRQSLTWRIAVNTAWASAVLPVAFVFSIVQTGMRARMLGPEMLGILGLLQSASGLSTRVFSLIGAQTLLTFVSRSLSSGDRRRAAGIVSYCYIADALSSLVAYAMFVLIAGFFPQVFGFSPGLRPLIVIFGLTIILSSTYYDSRALLRLGNRFQWLFFRDTIRSALAAGAVALLFFRGAGLRELVWLDVFLAGADGLSLFILAQVVLRERGLWEFLTVRRWWQVPAGIWRFNLTVYSTSIVKSGNRYVDTLMIGLIADPVQVGFYQVAKQINSYLQKPIGGFESVLPPEYSRLWFSGRRDQLRRLVRRFALAFAAVGLAAAVVLAVSIDWVIGLFVGPDYLAASSITLILLQSSVIVIAMTPLYLLPASVGRALPALKAAGIALVVQVVVMWLLVPGTGAVGAAWARVAYVAIVALVFLREVVRLLRWDVEESVKGRSPLLQEETQTRS